MPFIIIKFKRKKLESNKNNQQKPSVAKNMTVSVFGYFAVLTYHYKQVGLYCMKMELIG